MTVAGELSELVADSDGFGGGKRNLRLLYNQPMSDLVLTEGQKGV